MERPLLVLDGRNFQSGISTLGAHSDRGGIFYKAAGVTPLFGAGATQDPNNGLLMAGAAGSSVSYGSVTGAILNLIPDDDVYHTGGGIIAATDDNELINIGFSSGLPSGAFAIGKTLSGHTLTPGIVTFGISGARTLIYRQVDQIGKYVSSTYTDNWITSSISTDYFGALHVHYGLNKVIYGNGTGKIGTIDSSGTSTPSALTFDTNSYVSAISDDGVYVVAAITRNFSLYTDYIADTRVIFWDGSTTTGFIRDYPISDPCIYSLKRTPTGVYAFGITGIWSVSLNGVKKIFSNSPGVYTVSGNAVHYGQATSFFADALLWGGQVASGTSRALNSLGKLDSAALNAYLQPIIGTASKNITAVNGQLSKGYVYIADDTPQLKYYPIGSGTPQTGVSAQTVYFKTTAPVSITHIDVVFGEPLASGDTLDLDVYSDEDTSVHDFGSVSYTANKVTRRHQFAKKDGAVKVNLDVYQKFSILPTFTAGTPKIARIEVYGDVIAPENR